ncbi:ribose-phosphate pyrophosphokinase [Puttea exsequens]|nr:ribose-phosphate pyrophosphokinase [Puttea exsequens]
MLSFATPWAYLLVKLFPYSRQSDISYNKAGAPLSKSSNCYNKPDFTFDSKPHSPHPDHSPTPGLINGVEKLQKDFGKVQLDEANASANTAQNARDAVYEPRTSKRSSTVNPSTSDTSTRHRMTSSALITNMTNGTSHNNDGNASSTLKDTLFHPRPGYKPWVAQAGTLVADLLTCAGPDHIITMELHDPQLLGY